MSGHDPDYVPPAWTRPLAWFTNPHGLNDDARLRAAVAGKVVMVTGASFGIGEATAKRLAAMGAKVLLVARTRDKLEVVAEAARNPVVAQCVARNEADKRAQLIYLLEQAEQRQQLLLRMPAAQAADGILLVLDGAFGRAIADGDFKAERYEPLVLRALDVILEGRS